MSIILYTGKPGSGKSVKLASVILDVLQRNKSWYKKTGELRKIATNLELSDKLLQSNSDFFMPRWYEVAEIVKMSGVDIFWDEVANQMDAVNWQNLSIDVKVFLRHHEKRGIAIFATTQNYPTVDVQFRRLVNELYECNKLFGSPRPGPRKPPVERVWGLIWLTHFDPMTYDTEPKRLGLMESFMSWVWLDRELVDCYDTLQEIPPGKFPPLRHVERDCIDDSCAFKRVIHT